MAINKINDDIQSRRITQDSVKEATSGKKEKVRNQTNNLNKIGIEDKTLLSEDAKKLHETEVILHNALLKLREMDEINQENFESIKNKIGDNFYSNDEIIEIVRDNIFSENEIQSIVQKRKIAEKYISILKELDEEETAKTIVDNKLEKVKNRLNNGYYDSKEVIAKVANDLFEIMDT